MLVRIDISYPHQMVVGGQFPPSPSTVFQAIIAANGHRLDEVSDVLQLMEEGKCTRIVYFDKGRVPEINLRTALPRMPKASEVKSFEFGDPANKVLEPQKIFPLDGSGVHLSYYFEMGVIAPERLTDALKLHVLGRGESVCMSFVSVLDKLPVSENGTVWELSAEGWEPQLLHVPYPGFLRNLRLFHDAKKPNLKVPRRSETFSIMENSASPYTYVCYSLVDEEGEFIKNGYPQKNMPDIAAMMRHAMLAETQGKVDGAYVSGHAKVHPFYYPIPSIGMEYADGDIRRVIVAEPAAGSRLLAENVSVGKMLPLLHGDIVVCYARREPDNDGVLSRYLGASKIFRTVTPMIIDRAGGAQRISKRISALIKMAGFPEPTRIVFNKTWWAGRLPQHVLDASRAHVYVEVEFPVAVSGPVAAGVAAGYGIGLFAHK